MKIQVVRIDGSVEILNLVGTIEASEPGTDLEYPRNQSPLYVKSIGMRYFFREDGRYDGWEAECAIPISEGEDPMTVVKDFADAIEDGREFPSGNRQE
jgi:hypothetical protein